MGFIHIWYRSSIRLAMEIRLVSNTLHDQPTCKRLASEFDKVTKGHFLRNGTLVSKHTPPSPPYGWADSYRSTFDIQPIPTGQHWYSTDSYRSTLIFNRFLQVNIWYPTNSYRSTFDINQPIPTGQHLISNQFLQVNIWYSTDSDHILLFSISF